MIFSGGVDWECGVCWGEHSVLSTLIWSVVEKRSIGTVQPSTGARLGGPEFSFNMPLAIFLRTWILLNVSKWQLFRSDWFLFCLKKKKKKMFSPWANNIILKQENRAREQIFSACFLSNPYTRFLKGGLEPSLWFEERSSSPLWP